jgi:hypothetical protein
MRPSTPSGARGSAGPSDRGGSASRRILAIAVAGAGLADPAARTRRVVYVIIAGGQRFAKLVRADRRREYCEIDPLLDIAGAGILIARASIGPFPPRFEAFAGARRGAALLLLVAVAVGIAIVVGITVHPVIAVIVAIVVSLRLLILEARSAVTENAEIMVRELQIIFGLDAISGELGVPRHALVFLEQLRRIAALAVILAIAAGIARHALWALSTAAATAAALTIVDQS